jgi:hypothetical protein
MKLIITWGLLFVASLANADHHEGDNKPALFVSRTATMEATVEAIDHGARLVTLGKQDGSSITFTPSPDVRNLDQVSVGDVLVVEYSQSIAIQVADIEGVEPAEAAMAAIARSNEGEMPAMIAVDTSVVMASVIAIDLQAQTYKLRFVDDTVNEYVAMNPENLKMAAVGDLVTVEITESVIAEVVKMD